MPEFGNNTYISPTTGDKYNVHSDLLRTGALQALMVRRDLLREGGDSSALIEGYKAADMGLYRAPFELVALRFAGRVEAVYSQLDHRTRPVLRSAGIGFGASSGSESITVLRTNGKRLEILTDELLPDNSDPTVAQTLLDRFALLKDLTSGANLTEGDIAKALAMFSSPQDQAADYRFGYNLPGDITSAYREVRDAADQRFVLASIIE